MTSENEKKKNKFLSLKKFITPKVCLIIVVILAVCGILVGIRKYISSESQTQTIGFEDIGEMATQSAYCTQVNVTDKSRKLFGTNTNIPFTQSKYVYSYGVTVKAGFDFSEIDWEQKETTIKVYLPETKILSSEIDTNSFKVYHEAESIFTPISLEENNEALNDLVKKAEEDSIKSGLLENARENAEVILTGFFQKVYDPKEYTITFIDK